MRAPSEVVSLLTLGDLLAQSEARSRPLLPCLAAVARGATPGVNASAGMIYGSPEHDLCRDQDFYYHNNAWFVRGMTESGKLFSDLCPKYCPAGFDSFGATLLAEATRFKADLAASLAMTVTFGEGNRPFFVPPIARVGIAPYKSMI